MLVAPTISPDDDHTTVTDDAWTTPVVQKTVFAPAVASSLRCPLLFTQRTYSGTACTPISRVQIRSTVNGCSPSPGRIVIATLCGGYTFVTGLTTFAGTTSADGLITLPAILVPATGGPGRITACSEETSVSARISSPTTSARVRADSGAASA